MCVPGVDSQQLTPRYMHASVVWKERLVIMGGWVYVLFACFASAVCSLSPTQAPPLTSIFFRNTTPRFEDSTTDPTPGNDIWLTEDLKRFVQVSPTSSVWGPRFGHAAAVLNGSIYVLGGTIVSSSGDWVQVNDLWTSSDIFTWTEVKAYSPSTTTFMSVRVNPGGGGGGGGGGCCVSTRAALCACDVHVQPRYLHQAAVWHGYLYVSGGCTASKPASQPVSFTSSLKDVWRTTDGSDWELVSDYSKWAVENTLFQVHGRCAHNMFVAGGALYLGFGTYEPVTHGLQDEGATGHAYDDLWVANETLDCVVNGELCNGAGVCGPANNPGNNPNNIGKYPRLCECDGTFGGLFCTECMAGCVSLALGHMCGCPRLGHLMRVDAVWLMYCA